MSLHPFPRTIPRHMTRLMRAIATQLSLCPLTRVHYTTSIPALLSKILLTTTFVTYDVIANANSKGITWCMSLWLGYYSISSLSLLLLLLLPLDPHFLRMARGARANSRLVDSSSILDFSRKSRLTSSRNPVTKAHLSIRPFRTPNGTENFRNSAR